MTDTGQRRDRTLAGVAILASALVALCAIGSGSLWVDEFGTWDLTRAKALGEWWTRLQHWPDSDSQIPLYHLVMFGWAKLFGTGAYALRASNVPLFMVATLALVWPFRRRPAVALAVLVVSCASPTLWYYLDEIRPYVMLYLGVCLMLGGTVEIAWSPGGTARGAFWAVAAGAVIACGASVLGIPWAGMFGLFLLGLLAVGQRRRDLTRVLRANLGPILFAALGIALLLVHDARMFAQGSRAVLEYGNSLATVLFTIYGNAGFLGVGPGMLDLRADAAAALKPFIPGLTLAVLLLGLLALGGVLELRRRLGTRALLAIAACALVPFAFTLLLGLLLHWRVVARHVIPVLPLVDLIYAYGLVWWWSRGRLGRATALAAIAILAVSAGSIRLAARHAKDDYAGAAALANAALAQGGTVWWLADGRGARYYDVPTRLPTDPVRQDGASAVVLSSPAPSTVDALPAPSLVVLSKPDYFDQTDSVRRFLSERGYRLDATLPAFTVWSAPVGR